MSETTVLLLKEVGNPNKARIIAHLSKHKGEKAEDLGKHLGYPLPTVYKYLREMEAARVIRSEVRDKTRLYYSRDFRMELSPRRLREVFEEESIVDVYRAKSGDEGLKRFREVMKKVNAARMTYRQAASTLGISYYEFVLLMEETGAAR
ncbi:MAG TPA: winged helix-turn-helix domain-containing protein [Candidatus Bathyarchaeia archaeon]|nr:winged helix-turn-helix domain-containing protein [Candidatus Bathyarchaeia archaeon]